MTDELELMHIGVLRKSGRYPWGSGSTPHQRNKSFLNYVDELKKKGLSETDIAKGVGLSTTQLRALKSIAKDEVRKAEASQALRLQDKGLSNVAIAEKMGLAGESSVRALLDPALQERRDITTSTANMLKDEVSKHKYLDVGKGTEQYIGVSETKLKTALEALKEEGYRVDSIKIPQAGTSEMTRYKILSAPGTTYSEVVKNKEKITFYGKPQMYSNDGGRSFFGLRAPTNVSSKKIDIAYAEDGGTLKDGVIELRPGAKDLDLGKARYAQVRIAVDGTHYLKGMAVYANDLPDGVDIRFNTNKSKKEAPSKLSVMKEMKSDPDNPFGAVIKPGGQRGALNIISEEGDWYNWSGKLSSQMLSKQPPSLAKKQLDITYDIKRNEFDDIMQLTNPTVRRKLLESFADDADASSVHLKAIGLPRTKSHVILPFPKMKENEVYAPQFNDGEKVVLIRHPHGGIFEIPELTVNNKNRDARSILGRATDAIGINPKVAEKLSGADFDGDTVLVIPNKSGAVKTDPKRIIDFDPRTSYPGYTGMKVMKNTQTQMGMVSNLITDMTIRGANYSEIARAVRHSMVVIDAEKHKLNYKQSEKDNGIAELKKKYQSQEGKSSYGGATTLISRASSTVRVPDRKARPASQGGYVDIKTGEKKFVPTGETYVNKAGETVQKMVKSTRMAETKDAFTLSSGTRIEEVYANHANKLKALANEARKNAVTTKSLSYSPSAKETYSKEVSSLNSKLNIAKKNAPLERQAQLLANYVISAKRQAKPDMDADELKKVKGQALKEARERTGAGKNRIKIEDNEWLAIQSGAISASKLEEILNNSDLDTVKELATPRAATVMTPAKTARAQSLLAAGHTQSEVAAALGVPTSTLNSSLNQ